MKNGMSHTRPPSQCHRSFCLQCATFSKIFIAICMQLQAIILNHFVSDTIATKSGQTTHSEIKLITVISRWHDFKRLRDALTEMKQFRF